MDLQENRTKDINNPKLCVNRNELPEILGCGQFTADKISKQAGARIKIGKRVLIYIPKLEEYLKDLVY